MGPGQDGIGPAVFRGYTETQEAKRGCWERCLLKPQAPRHVTCPYQQTGEGVTRVTHKSSPREQNVRPHRWGTATQLTS